MNTSDPDANLSQELLSKQKYRHLIGYLISSAIAGEIVAAKAYAQMSLLTGNRIEMKMLLKEGQEELMHADMLEKLAKQLNVPFVNRIIEPEWENILAFIKEKANNNDYMSCFLAQEIVLESMAIVLYQTMSGEGSEVDNITAKVTKRILADELEHVDSGINYLKDNLRKNKTLTYEKLSEVNDKVLPQVYNLIRNGCDSLCSEMNVECGTFGPEEIGLDFDTLRLNALDRYMETLDEAGVEPEVISRLMLNVAGFNNKDSAMQQQCCC
ncbi:ferritin-like domain-containing protein [uncultured Shewanella sp.]|uniref:ferritin-like domain-containing protein n=1 Tax=uncultured Shewanella sp. TaxID=173975 RepID=UPI0026305BEF|nr:ferritin-like domain-containing protein [uncultured Shewanella sp.]